MALNINLRPQVIDLTAYSFLDLQVLVRTSELTET